jgi:hypothetical protein
MTLRWLFIRVCLAALVALGACSRSGGAVPSGEGGVPCSGRSTQFLLDAADRAGWFAIDSGQDCNPPSWLTILDAAGAEIAVGNPEQHCCTFANCATCSFEDVVCGGAWQTLALPVARTWDGMMFPRGTCGATPKACVTAKTCAPVGRYTARMCAGRYRDGGQPLEQPVTCVDVPFDLPGDGAVAGALP